MDRGSQRRYCVFNLAVLLFPYGPGKGGGRLFRIIEAILTGRLVCLALVMLSGVAVAGEVVPADGPIRIVAPESTIESLPKLARAVLSRNYEQVIADIKAGEPVNETVRAKEGQRVGEVWRETACVCGECFVCLHFDVRSQRSGEWPEQRELQPLQ